MHFISKILVVDDEPRICESLKYLLSSQENYEIFTANSGQAALELFSQYEFDVVLLDIVMPDISGHQLMDHINSLHQDIHVIVITGNASLDSAVSALRKGAYDYIRKPFEYDELLITVQNAVNQKKLKSEKKIINGKLELSEERYKYLIQNSPDIIYTLDDQGNFTYVSDAVIKMLGYNCSQLVGKHYTEIVWKENQKKAKWVFNERRTGDRACSGTELKLVKKTPGKGDCADPDQVVVEFKATGMYAKLNNADEKKFLGTHGVIRDISMRKLLEEKLQQIKQMEALGTLGGGIAHDFNNLLMGILGNVSLALLSVDPNDPCYEKLQNIEKAVQSGTDLTKQLLGFTRGGKYEVKPINLNVLAKKCLEMFGRVKKGIKIFTEFQKNIWSVEADSGQLEQVLLNLYVNASQAITDSGNICIKTENIFLYKNAAKNYQLKPGKYVKIMVRDTGIGMDDNTRQRIFEPFFTMKQKGRGTGLGLASAYGIINNHNGIITVSSQKGKGTTFNIFLPASEKEIIMQRELSSEILLGNETVFIIDDEDMILDIGRQMLEKLGYKVIVASDGEHALQIYNERKDEIDIVILDMIMPDMSGKETYEKLKEMNPDIKVLLSSGYSVDGQAGKILDQGCSGFIQKPFDINKLSIKIRDILDDIITLT